ncbi:MAG: hypothetical protein ACYTG0_43055 [Planctomycetota bacterium]|jgi:hypothetical protein
MKRSQRSIRRYAGSAARLFLVLGVTLACLGATGCSILGSSAKFPLAGSGVFSSTPKPETDDEAFVEAVKRDPFPSANQANWRVGVQPQTPIVR